ncbi:MAG: hypothetical protein LBH04_00670 [Tannerellaceae bacterium]|jgi:hypothetical protein|nr:hypothetical protein [Tannerellaceae bacterium]
MNKNIIYIATLLLITIITLQGCSQAPKHPWVGKTFETISEEDKYYIRGGDPRTDGLDYIIYILKQDTALLPDKAIFLTKDEHVILAVTDIGFTSDIFYVVENATSKKDNIKMQYLVKKRYFRDTDTADPLELWKYDTLSKKVKRVEISDDFVFGN